MKKLASVLRFPGMPFKVCIPFLLVMTIAFVSHAWNMFGYPYFENDEATYISRAWMFANEGKLDVYTYRYDHTPLGWMLTGGWLLLTGGEAIFGSLLNSGRVLMLMLFMASAAMVYVLTKRITKGNTTAALIATLLFAISPLAVYFHRRILLDNIMTFWILLSLIFATQPKPRLKYFLLSGFVFGIAVLTKLNAIFLLPAFAYIVWRKSHIVHRVHAIILWLAVAGFTILSFFLYAALKGELLPARIGPDGVPTRVSVFDTFALQLGRGEFAWPWQTGSSFMQNLFGWGLMDWTILVAGLASTIAITIVGFRRRKKQPLILAFGLIVWCMLAFLARGKLVLNLYIVPLLPFLAIAVGVAAYVIREKDFKFNWFKPILLAGMFLVVAMSYALFTPQKLYSTNETGNQLEAVAWARTKLPKNAIIAADNYMYPYLALESKFMNVSYFFSAEYDPEVRETYDNDWRNIEYLVVTHEVVEQMKTGTVPRMKQVFDHAQLVADFRSGTSSFIDLDNYISTNGDWVQIYKIKDRNDIVLQDSWKYFKEKYVVDYGQVVNPSQNDLTMSIMQAEAMTRAVEQDDMQAFRGLWQWSTDHLQHREGDKLLSDRWQKSEGGDYAVTNTNASCDANQQFAYALYKGAETWKRKSFKTQADELLNDWWKHCILERGGRLYTPAFADGVVDMRPVNMAAFNPEVYRYLSVRTADYPWNRLITDGYDILEQVFGATGTMPNWRLLTLQGELMPAQSVIGDTADDFGRNSLELMRRIGLDYYSHSHEASVRLLNNLDAELKTYAAKDNGPHTVSVHIIMDQIKDKMQIAQKLYEDQIHERYDAKKGSWSKEMAFEEQVIWWQWHRTQSEVPDEMKLEML